MADGCCGWLPLPVAPAPAGRCTLFPSLWIAQGCCDPGCVAPQRFAAGCCLRLRRVLAAPGRLRPDGPRGSQLACRITQQGAFFVVLLRKSACKFTLSIFRPSFPRDTGAHAKRGAQRRLPAITSAPADSSGDARRKLGTPGRRAPVPKCQMPSTILLFCCRRTACSCSGAKGRRMEGRKKCRTRRRLRDPSARESRE